MIPDFDEHGNLPPGIHRCTVDEVSERFGHGSPEREVETAELIEFVRWARQTGVQRLIVDGSYATEKIAPNDVDLAVLLRAGYSPQARPVRGLTDQWPFLHIMIAADEVDLKQWAHVDFGTDRNGDPRGILEIEL
jgi:hypothetical protein